MRNERKAIREVAKKHGITEIEAVANIEEAISAAIRNAKEENNGDVLLRWKEIPCVGEYPNAYELVRYLAQKARHGR